MAILLSEKIEKEAVEIGASMMAISARTAPKGRGVDSIKTLIVTGEDLENLAVTMEKKVREKSPELPFFRRDADNVRSFSAVLLIGVSGDPKKVELPLNCGACGYRGCENLQAKGKRQGEDFTGPICIFQAVDLGIALGSAVKLAGELNIDNRIMYTVGAGAKKLNLLDSDLIIGIPLSVTGKNPYFDRP
ncbi:MAG: hypothetical protein KGZ49_10260 [Syntrophaceae bacterium]|nr:hypothetical protein [Syntrophaceae bacterium]